MTWAAHSAGRAKMRITSSRLQRRQADGLQGADRLPVGEVVEVPGRSRDVAVTEELGDHGQGRPGGVELDGEGMPQRVRVNPLVNPGPDGEALEHQPDILGRDRAAAVEGAEQRAARADRRLTG